MKTSPSVCHFLFLAHIAVLLGCSASVSPASERETKAGKNTISPSDIFRTTNIWTVHLRFAPEQWEAMEPKQAERAGRGPGQSFLLGSEGGRNGLAAAFGWQFEYVRADLEFGSKRFNEVGVRYKGNGTFVGSRESLKRSLKTDLNQFVKGQKLAGISQLNLHNGVRDPASMNETVAYWLFREAGVPAPRTAYAKVFITVPGKHDQRYVGLYTLVEDVGKAFVEEHFGTSKGAILKPVTPSLFTDLGDDWKNYNQTYDPKGSLSDTQKKRVVEFCKVVAKADDAEFAAKLGNYIDIDNFARYMAVTAWLSDVDGILGPGQNYYLYLHPQTQKFIFIPWDQDQTFGQFPRGSEEQRENLSLHKPWLGENQFLNRVFRTQVFKQAYLATLEEFSKTILRPESIHRLVDALAVVLRPVIQEESSEKLAKLNKAAAGERISVMSGPRGVSQVKPIKAFVVARTQSVGDQLAGKSEGQTIEFGLGSLRRRPGNQPIAGNQ